MCTCKGAGTCTWCRFKDANPIPNPRTPGDDD